MAATTAFEKHARVACRTYTLSLALSLLPALIPAIAKPQSSTRIPKILKRELGPTGFAFSMTLAVAGGRLLDKCLNNNEMPYANWKPSVLLTADRTFLANVISSTLAIVLFTSRKKKPAPSTSSIPFTLSVYQDNSPTLDLTLLILVRALDAHLQSYLQDRHLDTPDTGCDEEGKPTRFSILKFIVRHMDVILFWLACSRINSLADMDTRLINALQALRNGTWKYGKPVLNENLLETMAHDMGMDPRLGNPAYLPAYGGSLADQVWKEFNIHGREGTGGIPCDIVHSGTAGKSCTGNATIRFGRAFIRAILIYAPVTNSYYSFFIY
ncbi:hypothetical protein Clacol_003697 [Clathrus columnatus]|uniref:Uncharacterized protein n=1 Tax=Clathrus columnatus TaxID=1419009 RepID=A0AAV5A9R6_9AGAM|nr:hypothetical protein Clacol_003697 [Clathrus columnatus]